VPSKLWAAEIAAIQSHLEDSNPKSGYIEERTRKITGRYNQLVYELLFIDVIPSRKEPLLPTVSKTPPHTNSISLMSLYNCCTDSSQLLLKVGQLKIVWFYL
jgi:hypothetical protein